MKPTNQYHPPRLGEWILQHCLGYEDRQHRLGDFEEVFQYTAESEGRLCALRWYWWQVLRSIPELVRNSFVIESSIIKAQMVYNSLPLI